MMKNNQKLFYCICVITYSLYISLGHGQTEAIPKVSCGQIIRLPNFASQFVIPRNVDIWLPDEYSTQKKYSVLYMHDGQMLFDSSITWNHQSWEIDETMCQLIKTKKIRNFIVVGIWSIKLRVEEYFPKKAYNYINKKVKMNTPNSDNYLKFIVNELRPYINSHFSTLSNQENTFIAGSSMGGLISMYAISEYPNIFGAAACMSTHWVGIDPNIKKEDNPVSIALLKYFKEHLPSAQNHKIYFDYGTKTLDASYKPHQEEADKIMKNAGYNKKNWLTREFPGDDHSEKSWANRFKIPISFLSNGILD